MYLKPRRFQDSRRDERRYNMFESFILAGGKSSRMKRNKAFLQLEGKTLLDIQNGKLKKIGSKKISVVLAEEAENFENYTVITDFYKNRGTLGGIHSALENCGEKYALILACDMPFVSEDLLHFLVKTIEKENTDCVAPIQKDGIIQPLCAVYDAKKCVEILAAIFDEFDETPSARDFLKRIETRFIEFAEFSNLPNSENFFFNLNTPENYRTAQKIASQ